MPRVRKSEIGRKRAGLLAYVGAASFAGLLASIPLGRNKVPSVLGIVSHIAMLPAVAHLPAPPWSRAGGYLWMLGDTQLGVVQLNVADSDLEEAQQQDRERLITSMRYGLHVCAATWVIPASWRAPGWQRLLGVVFGTTLAGYSFVANRLPRAAMAPIGVLQILWLTWIGWTLRRDP